MHRFLVFALLTGCSITSDTDDHEKNRDMFYCIGACISYRDEKIDHSKDVDVLVLDPNAVEIPK